MNEIGSEYHYIEKNKGKGIPFPSIVNDYSLVFSGRTAIETIIENTKIRKVMFPSYCCDSMLQPFRNANIDICFYQVDFDNGLKIDINIPEDVNCILWCNYFGFNTPMPDFSDFLSHGGIIIEDITHSYFSRRQYDDQSCFLIASLRKWDAILCGGYCATKEGILMTKPSSIPSKWYVSRKKKAMIDKLNYLENKCMINKEEYINGFQECNFWLSNNYHDLTIDDESKEYLMSIDTDNLRRIRINNAMVIYKGLDEINCVKPMFEIDEMDCPLFVPVIVESSKREKIRQELINHSIYCPVHWPKPNADCESNLYNLELSIICDQRYSETDMNEIVTVLKEIDKEG